ncbi:MAG: flavin reductase family protein [Betaproteobacteria bacterium]|nr:flavin reductase family protein [Betaproteobacteria bacterium]
MRDPHRAAPPFDARALRDALGGFATGVTVITTCGDDGRPVGLTVSSFNSVSLDPPLVLWSLSLHSPNLAAFRRCSHYAVNVLAAEQEGLSAHFAASGIDRFGGMEVQPGLGGAPLLPGCCAWFECRNEARHAGGDHIIFVGRVERFAREDRAPLLFHGGRYRRLA